MDNSFRYVLLWIIACVVQSGGCSAQRGALAPGTAGFAAEKAVVSADLMAEQET